ncbi:MAG: hypothetical protein ACYDBJ_29280, partial [Aggregatilineales bacterium]
MTTDFGTNGQNIFGQMGGDGVLFPKVAGGARQSFAPGVYEGVTRLATWMPFGQAVKEAGHFLHVTLTEATVRRQSE